MIQPEELRKGNLINGVYYTEGFEDDEIEKESVCDFLGYNPQDNYLWVNSKDHIEEFDRFEPIPLTEEWLLKMPRIEMYDYVLRKSGRGLHIELRGINIATCDYVHEYQNFYYITQRSEITLKQ